jgi:hypothetical protein
VYNDGLGTIIQMKGDQVLYQVNGRNTYVNVSDIIKQGDDPSLLMERILASKYVGYDEKGKPVPVKSEAEVEADISSYAKNNAIISNTIETNANKEVADEAVPVFEETGRSGMPSVEEVEASPIVPVFEETGRSGMPSVEEVLNKAAEQVAPAFEETGRSGLSPVELTAPELTVPKLPDEFLDATDPYITLPDKSLFDTTDYDPDQIKKMFPTDKKVATADPVSVDQSIVDAEEVSSVSPSPLRNIAPIVETVTDVGSSLWDSITSSFAKGKEKQEERDRILAETIRKNKIARQDAARAAEVEQAKKDSASQALRKQTVASGKIDQAKEFQNLSTQKSSITGESEQDVVDRIRRRQKDEAYKAAIALKKKQPTYVPPTAPEIKYDVPTGPFAKGGLAKMKAKKPAKKRKGGLASKKK